MSSNYICALDLGSSKIACSLAKLKRHDSIESLFLDSIPSKGIRRGRIVDSQDAADSIDKLLKIMKQRSGINIHFVCINICSHDVSAKHSSTVISLAERGSKLITPSDLRRVREEASILGTELEEEIIQAIPFSYNVDGRDNITNPLGLYGRKLGIDLFIISVNTGYLQGIHRLLNRLGYEIKHLFLSGLATSKVILDEDSLRDGLYVFCDIGADLTEIVIFENAVLQHIETLSFGGDDLTQEIAGAFKIPFELAEEIKCTYARVAESDQITADKEVMIKKDDYYRAIPQRKVCEVITYKARSFCSRINDKLNQLITRDKVISKIFVGGRTVLVDGFLETMESMVGIPIDMTNSCRSPFLSNTKLDSVSSVPLFLNYATSLGILCEAIEHSKGSRFPSLAPSKNLALSIIDWIKEIYQEYF